MTMGRFSVVAGLLLVRFTAAYAAPVAWTDYKAIYEKETEKIEQEYRAAGDEALGKYAKSLDRLLELAKERGDLDLYEAARAEKERFDTTRTVPEEPAPELPPILVRVCSGYRDMVSQARADRATRTLRLIRGYVPRLDTLKRAAMAEERIDEAKTIQTEIDRVAFIEADIVSKLPKPGPAPQPEPERDSRGTGRIPLALRRGLVLYCDFTRDDGRSVKDVSGNGNDGKVNGPTWTDEGIGAGGAGGAYEFDGKDDQIYLPVKPDPDASIAGWVKPATPSPMDVWGDEGWSRGCGLVLMADGFSTLVCDGTPRRQPSGFRADVGRWHHVVQVFGRKDTRTYIDGELRDTSGFVLAQQQIEPFSLGRASAGAFHTGFFRGSIDEFAIWDRALSEQEVRQLYEAAR
jgi:hypothetical protein